MYDNVCTIWMITLQVQYDISHEPKLYAGREKTMINNNYTIPMCDMYSYDNRCVLRTVLWENIFFFLSGSFPDINQKS